MKNFRLYSLISLLLVGCFQPPDDIEEVPTIALKSISNSYFITSGNSGGVGDGIETNRVEIVLEFKDGDGDLGLSSDDILDNPTFADTLPNGDPNLFVNNYFFELSLYKTGDIYKAGDTLIPIIFPEGTTLGGKFNRLPRSNDNSPISGTLKYVFDLAYTNDQITPQLLAGDTLAFQVQIADRSLNLSNVVTSNSESTRIVVLDK